MPPPEPPSPEPTELGALLAADALRVLYQPVVDLATEEIAGYEALARGPEGSDLFSGAALFASAGPGDAADDLDRACLRLALSGAAAAGLHRSKTLLVNTAPETLRDGGLALGGLLDRRGGLVVELPERALLGSPATLLATAASVRRGGHRLAIGLGAGPGAAMLELVRPEVVKLDLGLVHARDPELTALRAATLRGYLERHDALVVAQGIETPEHRETAVGLGAQVGQGWLFGHPGPLGPTADAPTRTVLPTARLDVRSTRTPFEVLAERVEPRRMAEPLLRGLVQRVERALGAVGDGLLIGVFGAAEEYTDAVRARFRELATHMAFVGVVGAGSPAEPGVRDASGWRTEALRGETGICGVGPWFAAAVAARDSGQAGSDGNRCFDVVETRDWEHAVAATQSLMVRFGDSG